MFQSSHNIAFVKFGGPVIAKDVTLATVARDPFMSLGHKLFSTVVLNKAEQLSGGTGIIPKNQVVRVAVHAGLGYMGARALGGLFSLSPTAQHALSATGVLAGALDAALADRRFD